jgi:GTPase
VVINKADIDPGAAEIARHQMMAALGMLRPASPNWKPRVLSVSALGNQGIEEFWEQIGRHREAMVSSGEFASKRRRQALAWMWQLIDAGLRARFQRHPRVRADLADLSQAVERGTTSAATAAERLLSYLR